jgi:peptide chain release factor subunit 1
MLTQEYGTASNIKSRVNRLSVLSAITSTQQRLKLYNRGECQGGRGAERDGHGARCGARTAKATAHAARLARTHAATLTGCRPHASVPPNGLVIYCGTILTDEGKEKRVNFSFEPFKRELRIFAR